MSKKHARLRSVLSLILVIAMTLQQSGAVALASDTGVLEEAALQAQAEAVETEQPAPEPAPAAEAPTASEEAPAPVVAEPEPIQEAPQVEEPAAEPEKAVEAETVEPEETTAQAEPAEETGETTDIDTAEPVEETSVETAALEDTENFDVAEEAEIAAETETDLHEARPVTVSMSIVTGSDNRPVDDSYIGLSLPEYEGELPLNVSPYKEDVTVAVPVEGTSRLYVSRYDYAYATINGKTLKSLRRVPAVTESLGENGELIQTPVDGYEYLYSVDGREYLPLLEDSTLFLHYTEEEQKTREYDYNDHKSIHVHAYVNDPAAIPDNAELVVTPITSGSAYDAYIQALNNQAEQIAAQQGAEEANTFDASNTLLYDIAFLSPKADDDGNVIPGEFVEVKPDHL